MCAEGRPNQRGVDGDKKALQCNAFFWGRYLLVSVDACQLRRVEVFSLVSETNLMGEKNAVPCAALSRAAGSV